MNGLFFGNTASSGGVDPRYPVIIPDYVGVCSNVTNYLRLQYAVQDKTYSWNKISWTYDKNCHNITIKLVMKTQWSFLAGKVDEVEYALWHCEATNPGGFTTKKDIPLFCQTSYNGKSIEIEETSTYSVDLIELFSDVEPCSDYNYTSAKCYDIYPYSNQWDTAYSPYYNVKLNGTVLQINQITELDVSQTYMYIFIVNAENRTLFVKFIISKVE